MKKKFGIYKGRRVRLDHPSYIRKGEVGYGRKKFKVYADMGGGKVKRVMFGQRGVRIKAYDPKRRKSFRARHSCDKQKPKDSAGYWSCRKW